MHVKSEKEILDLNVNSPDVTSAPTSIEDVIARGAATANATEPETAPDTGIEFTEPRKRRGRKPKAAAPTPDEMQQAKDKAELDAFFSADGIGKVFAGAVNAFYLACNAAPLTEQEAPMLASGFAQWARYRLPASASAYQPDILLVAMLGMTTLPRIQPIADTTAPFWKRTAKRLLPWRKKPAANV